MERSIRAFLSLFLMCAYTSQASHTPPAEATNDTVAAQPAVVRGKEEAMKLMKGILSGNLPEYVQDMGQLPGRTTSMNSVVRALRKKNPNDAERIFRRFTQSTNTLSTAIPTFIQDCDAFYKDILDFASGKDKIQALRTNERNYFRQVFEKMANFGHTLSANDLFHGHVMLVADTVADLYDIIIIFHAKEFPEDKPHFGGAKSRAVSPTQFSTANQEFYDRNFLWSLRTNKLYLLRYMDFEEYDVYEGFAKLITRGVDGDDQGIAVQEDYFGKHIFDINYFKESGRVSPTHGNNNFCPRLFVR